jgi:hypothetical protein
MIMVKISFSVLFLLDLSNIAGYLYTKLPKFMQEFLKSQEIIPIIINHEITATN